MTKTKRQTIKEHERTHNERQLAILAINLAVAVTKASSAGYDMRVLTQGNPRYLESLSDNLKALNQGYKSVRAKVSKDVAQFYDTQIQGVLGDSEIIRGLSKWEGGLRVRL